MITYEGICLKTKIIEDSISRKLTIEKDKKYRLALNRDGTVTILSNYWVRVSSKLFTPMPPEKTLEELSRLINALDSHVKDFERSIKNITTEYNILCEWGCGLYFSKKVKEQ